MPDIRIKDLTTTASSTASDDFFAADGTTNGTRKLSAYSPSFGGNATVGGTLTVTGALTTSSIVNNGANGVALDTGGSASLRFTDSATSKWWIYKLSGDPLLYFRDMVNARMQMVMSPGATSSAALTSIYSGVSIDSTTASTSTSSGALVVGNGTSGGLGVGGAATIGGMVKGAASTYAGSPPAGVSSAFQVDVENATTRDVFSFGDESRAGLLRGYHDGSGFVRWSFGRYAGGAYDEYARLEGTTSANGKLFINATTASTTTSSGALVVSGGVGVAKEVYVGTTLKLANTSRSVAAWGDIGAQLSVAGAVITDTSSSGTVSRAVVNSIAASALAASSTTTYTQAASLFVAGAPTANTNVTITNAYAIYTAGGRINFQGLPTSSAGLQAGTLWNDGGALKVA